MNSGTKETMADSNNPGSSYGEAPWDEVSTQHQGRQLGIHTWPKYIESRNRELGGAGPMQWCQDHLWRVMENVYILPEAPGIGAFC